MGSKKKNKLIAINFPDLIGIFISGLIAGVFVFSGGFVLINGGKLIVDYFLAICMFILGLCLAYIPLHSFNVAKNINKRKKRSKK